MSEIFDTSDTLISCAILCLIPWCGWLSWEVRKYRKQLELESEERIMARGIGRAKPNDPGFDVGEVEVVKIYPSGKALLVRMKDNDEERFPFSQIHEDSEIHAGNCALETMGRLVVSTWIAGQKKLLGGSGDGC